MRLIDSHAHYEHMRFDKDRDTLLASMTMRGVDAIINVGCDLSSSIASVELAKKYAHVYATVGVHPHEAKTLNGARFNELRQLCSHEKVVAYGEIGLDFHYDFSAQIIQRHWFKQQLGLVAELDLPVIIHSRNANEEVFDTIVKSPVRRGVIHCFPGDNELAAAYVELGFHIGVGGVITYDKTGMLESAVAAVPLERILLETDAPYLTPVPLRGKRNESHYLFHVAREIAKIKGVSPEEVCAVTSANARELFSLGNPNNE